VEQTGTETILIVARTTPFMPPGMMRSENSRSTLSLPSRISRAMPPSWATRVVLTTGYAEASLERSDAGGSEFEVISKPYRRTDLARRDQKWLSTTGFLDKIDENLKAAMGA
jgi:hypothetical protein